MAAGFVYVGGKWVNLDKIESAETNRDGTHRLMVAGEVVDERNANFLETIAAVVPENRALECLTYCEGDDEHPEDEISIEPVLAWAWTVQGQLIPITPSAPEGVKHGEEYGLRHRGEERVFGSAIGGYANAEAWLAAVLRRKPKLKAA
jgi:hypothetical protein